MRLYRREHAIDRIWPTVERILVCVGPSPMSTRLVRGAKRMADHYGAEWIAAYVETPAQLQLSAETRDSVVQTLRLAEQLGAQTIRLSGPTMSEALLAYAHDRNVTRIIVGKPRRTRFQRVFLGSIVDALVKGSGDIDVHVIGGGADEDAPATTCEASRVGAGDGRRGTITITNAPVSTSTPTAAGISQERGNAKRKGSLNARARSARPPRRSPRPSRRGRPRPLCPTLSGKQSLSNHRAARRTRCEPFGREVVFPGRVSPRSGDGRDRR